MRDLHKCIPGINFFDGIDLIRQYILQEGFTPMAIEYLGKDGERKWTLPPGYSPELLFTGWKTEQDLCENMRQILTGVFNEEEVIEYFLRTH